MPIDTKSSWSAAAGIEAIAAGVHSMRCSTIRVSAVYWLSIMPLNMPAPLVRNDGRPALRAGFSRRFRRRSDSTLTMVMAWPAISIGSDTGEPWKLAPGLDGARLGKEDGIVADAVQFDLDLAARVGHRVVGGADDLGRRAHGIRVLHAGLDLAGQQVAAVDAAADGRGAADGPAEAAHHVQRRLVGLQVGQQRLQRHGGRDLGLLQPAFHVADVQRAHGRQQVRAVDRGQPVARVQPGGVMPARRSASAPGSSSPW